MRWMEVLGENATQNGQSVLAVKFLPSFQERLIWIAKPRSTRVIFQWGVKVFWNVLNIIDGSTSCSNSLLITGWLPLQHSKCCHLLISMPLSVPGCLTLMCLLLPRIILPAPSLADSLLHWIHQSSSKPPHLTMHNTSHSIASSIRDGMIL